MKRPETALEIILSFSMLWGASYYMADAMVKHCGAISPFLFSVYTAIVAYWAIFNFIAEVHERKLTRRHALVGTVLCFGFGFFDQSLQLTPMTKIKTDIFAKESVSYTMEDRSIEYRFSLLPLSERHHSARALNPSQYSSMPSNYDLYLVHAVDAERGSFLWGIHFESVKNIPGLERTYRGVFLRHREVIDEELHFQVSNGYRYSIDLKTQKIRAIPPSRWKRAFRPPECSL